MIRKLHSIGFWLKLLLLCLTWGSFGMLTKEEPNGPNIVLLLADDLGYGDPACYGNEAIKTPHIDALAADGMRFTQFYAASAVCTPTRASILTGKYPLRFNITQHFKDRGEHLPTEVVTLAELLREAGYFTAHIGKWHLGGLRRADLERRRRQEEGAAAGPAQQGFDHYLVNIEESEVRGKLHQERRLFREGGQFLLENEQRLPPKEQHWTDIKGDAAVNLIRKAAQNGQPFFLNLWFDVPHTPYEPTPEPFLSQYQNTAPDPANGHYNQQNQPGDGDLYNAMVAHMDAQIGKVIKALKETGQYDNTLIIFSSDNGPAYRGSTGPWKAGKADLHEGGIRVPTIAVWKNRIPAGTTSDGLMSTVDLLPTFCAAAGIKKLPGEPDGINLLPHLTDKKKIPENRTLLWQLDLYTWYPQPGDKPQPYTTEAIRRGDWKLMTRELKPVFLYNLNSDPGEQRNLLGTKPRLEKTLLRQLQSFVEAPRKPYVQVSYE